MKDWICVRVCIACESGVEAEQPASNEQKTTIVQVMEMLWIITVSLANKNREDSMDPVSADVGG